VGPQETGTGQKGRGGADLLKWRFAGATRPCNSIAAVNALFSLWKGSFQELYTLLEILPVSHFSNLKLQAGKKSLHFAAQTCSIPFK